MGSGIFTAAFAIFAIVIAVTAKEASEARVGGAILLSIAFPAYLAMFIITLG